MTYFFEDPWVLVVGLVVVGALLRSVGRRRGHARTVMASWLAYALAVGCVGLAAAVNTDREQIEAQTKAMLVSAESAGSGGATNARAQRFDAFFTPRVGVEGPGGSVWEITDAAGLTQKLQQRRVRGTALRRFEITAPPAGSDRATTQMRVSSRVGEGYREPTTWELGWTRTAQGWRIDRLRWLELRDHAPSPGLYH